MTVCDPVVLVSDRSIPEEVAGRIIAKILSGCSHSTVCCGSIDGQSTFSYLGFE